MNTFYTTTTKRVERRKICPQNIPFDLVYSQQSADDKHKVFTPPRERPQVFIEIKISQAWHEKGPAAYISEKL